MDAYGIMGIREMKPVNTSWLPSKGIAYPDNIEIYVAPLTIRERRLLEGATQAGYYEGLLKGIEIRGGQFDKNDLLYADIQYLDLVRRIHTFELDKKITIVNYPCDKCSGEEVKLDFMFTDVDFEEMNEEIFGTTEIYTNDETGEKKEISVPGKVYTFTDGMQVLVAPLTIREYIDMATVYLSNISENKLNERVAEIYVAQFTYLIKRVIDREYPNDKARRDFLKRYIGNLYKDADAKVLEQIEKDTVTGLKPLEAYCPDCGSKVEVFVQPTCTFQQEV